ncbi:Uu.00g145810.m01.CDS01 [Anthostomella pinea]|uniref:Uu.00g145810.m01.CDS01 n=1 Tax=Anthostomella pinea TaxID=933095 RepID=A0AAI8VR56_9PEZI|nr:Uu.00g145810.m01.CDS01 [Anthostomella pinea]
MVDLWHILETVVGIFFDAHLTTWNGCRVELNVEMYMDRRQVRDCGAYGVTFFKTQNPPTCFITLFGNMGEDLRKWRVTPSLYIVETLLHQMVHAFIELYWNRDQADRAAGLIDDGGHGPIFEEILTYIAERMEVFDPVLANLRAPPPPPFPSPEDGSTQGVMFNPTGALRVEIKRAQAEIEHRIDQVEASNTSMFDGLEADMQANVKRLDALETQIKDRAEAHATNERFRTLEG